MEKNCFYFSFKTIHMFIVWKFKVRFSIKQRRLILRTYRAKMQPQRNKAQPQRKKAQTQRNRRNKISDTAINGISPKSAIFRL